MRSERAAGPLGRVDIVNGDEGRFTAHREPYVPIQQVGVDLLTESRDGLPMFLAIRLGHPRRFKDPVNRHLVEEFSVTVIDKAGNGSGAACVGRACQRDVPFSREHSGGGVKPDPSGAGQIDFRPGV